MAGMYFICAEYRHDFKMQKKWEGNVLITKLISDLYQIEKRYQHIYNSAYFNIILRAFRIWVEPLSEITFSVLLQFASQPHNIEME